jgi:ornithine cyclodeaminase/alanine dehydrogenase-like protein (mu-crystallin family)
VTNREGSGDVTVVSAETVRALVPIADAIEAVRLAFIDFSGGRIVAPTRMTLPDGGTLVMLARRGAREGTVVKVISIRDGNAAVGLSNLQSMVVWLDGPTGEPVAVVHGGTVTSLRTGAASGAATALLAPAGASVLAMLGAGDQAPDQIEAVCAVRSIQEIRIWSRHRASSDALAAGVSRAHPDRDVRAVSDPDEAVRGADVVCTATPSRDALFAHESLGRPVHINAIGSYRPDMREIPAATVAAADPLVVDSREAASMEAGEIVQALEEGALELGELAELGELLAAPSAPPTAGLSVFKSVGIGAQDWAVTGLAVSRAAERTDLRRVSLTSSEA